MKTMNIQLLIVTILSAFLLISCGNGDNEATSGNDSGANITENGLTVFEMEHGVGPVTESVTLGSIDSEKVDQGRSIYQMKCEACHNMEGRMVGPGLGDVTERRSAEFVMNFILNPDEMLKDHPEGQKMLQEYMVAMPFQNVSRDEARALVEYLRDYAANK